MAGLSWEPPAGRALVLAAHPDDEVIGCAGAMLRHLRRGDRVSVVIVTAGEAGVGAPAARRREARAAARALGVAAPAFWDFPDGRLDGARGLASKLARLIRRLRPTVVYRPGSDEAHPDHRALGRAAASALRACGHPVWDCRYEVWPTKPPTRVLDVSADFPRKTRALSLYRSQRGVVEPVRLARRLNAGRGLLIGVAFGEGYRLSRRRSRASKRGRA